MGYGRDRRFLAGLWAARRDRSIVGAMHLHVICKDGLWRAGFGGAEWPCAVGRGGVRPDKAEGDGATPAGCWPLRRLYYRPDRLEIAPQSSLPAEALTPELGWCDDPGDSAYNTLVKRPYPGRHELLWREDRLYDIVGVMGYNDDPPYPGRGSAIFLHLARDDYGPTEGCVALALPHLLDYLRAAGPGSEVRITK